MKNFSTSYSLLAKSVNQVIYFQTNCFTFRMKFWMPQVRKSRFCGISDIFFQCCFMSEAQVLITVSNFFCFFSKNHVLEGGFTFQWMGFIFKWVGDTPWGGSIGFDGGGGVACPLPPPCPPLWETLSTSLALFVNRIICTCFLGIYEVELKS